MMEGLGYISTAEAFIAARHRSAWNAALRLAKTKGIYTGVDIEPLTIVNQLQRLRGENQVEEVMKNGSALCAILFPIARRRSLMRCSRGVSVGRLDDLSSPSSETMVLFMMQPRPSGSSSLSSRQSGVIAD